MTVRVAIAAGGTAGHINPALALAKRLQEEGAEVIFVGQSQKLEGELVPQAGFELVPIRVSGLDRSRPWTAIAALAHMRRAKRNLAKYFSQTGWPEVAIGFGAYVELALLKLCKKHHIPYLLHEQNSVPGLANKMLAKDAATIAYAFPKAKERLQAFAGPDTHFSNTGIPVRKEIGSVSKKEAKRTLNLKPNSKVLLVFGGSLGAVSINDALQKNVQTLLDAEPTLEILHATGKEAYESYVKSALKNSRYHIVPYFDDMAVALGAADFVLSRSGASTISELIASKKPALLVPYPLATEDHQNTNANLLVDVGAAIKMRDADLQTAKFKETVLKTLKMPIKLSSMQLAYGRLSSADATDALVHQVLQLT